MFGRIVDITPVGVFGSPASGTGSSSVLPPWAFPEVMNYYDARYGVTVASEAVSDWAPVSGSGSLTQGTGAAQPLYMPPATGGNYLWMHNNNTFPSCPDSALFAVSQFSVAALVALYDWSPAGINPFLVTHGGSTLDVHFALKITQFGNLQMLVTTDGTTFKIAASSVAVPGVDGDYLWLMATCDATSTGNVKFYTAPAPSGGAALPTTWTQLGTTQTITTGALWDSASTLAVGGCGNSGTVGRGYFRRALFWSGILDTSGAGGTLLADIDATRCTEGQATYTDGQGNLWTIGAAASLQAQVVTRPWLIFDRTDDLMSVALTLAQPFAFVFCARHNQWSSGRYMCDGVTLGGITTGAVQETTASPQINLHAGSSVAGNTNWTVSTKMVVGAYFNGASSMLAVNETTPTTGNPGAGTPNGITVGASGANPATNFGAIQLTALAIVNQSMTQARLQELIRSMMTEYNV